MSDSTADTEYQQFLAFKAQQAQTAATAPEPAPLPTVADVLKALVNAARLADEGTVRLYHEAIDAWHNATTGTGDNAA